MTLSHYPPLRYLDVQFECSISTPGRLPAYLGSTLRGCLGAHLRNGLCMTRNKDCQICILGSKCIFPRIFNPAQLEGLPVPPPFCVEPDLSEKTDYKTGDAFTFRLKLFSYGVDYLPFFVQAFRMAGEKGIGNPAGPARFNVEKAICSGNNIYDAELDNLNLPEPEFFPPLDVFHANCKTSELQLHLLTPLRHKNDNHFSATLSFADLLNLILRRIRSLYLSEGITWQLEPEIYQKLKEAAVNISIKLDQLHWRDWTRYSSRQDTRMKLGGLAGKVVYQGELSLFHNLARFAQIAHIGKQTSFGLGLCQADFTGLPKC